MRTTGWVIMTFLSVAVAAYAAAVLLVPGFGPPFVADRRTIVPLAVLAHLAGGLTALALGPWQLHRGLRTRYLARHRWIGKAYVVAVMIGGLGGLALAPLAQEGFASHVGFGLLATLWLSATLLAYRSIRDGDRARHREWMIRSFAMTLAAVTLRIYIPLSVIAGIPFNEAYPAIAWLCWVPNLILAEWFILDRRRVPDTIP